MEIIVGSLFEELVHPIPNISIRRGEDYYYGDGYSKHTKKDLWYAYDDIADQRDEPLESRGFVLGNKGFKTAEACYKFACKKFIAYSKREVKNLNNLIKELEKTLDE